MDNKEILDVNGGKKIDICLMNPPYNNGISNTFLYKILNIGNKVITIQPDSYLFKGKNGIEKIKNILNDGNTNIESIDANNFFDGAFQNRIAILTYINDNSKNVIYNDRHIDDLMKLDFRQDDDLIIEFKNIVKELYSSNNCGNKWKGVPGSHYPDKYVNNEDENSWIVQCVLLRGHVAPQQRDGKANDFYTLITNNDKLLEKQFIGKYKDLINIKDNKGKTKLQYYYKFNSEKEAHNFINYIKTDFARACLYLKKKDMNVNWECIPWFDFSDPHFSKTPHEIDDWLFEKYNIRNEIRKHIEEILPDYYGGKRFDCILMNPPYGAKENGNYLDIKFVDKCLELADKQIVIIPAKLASNASIYKNFYSKNHIKDIILLDPNKVFGIRPFGAYKYVGIYEIDSKKLYDKLKIHIDDDKTYYIENTFESRTKFMHEQNWDKDIINLIDKFETKRKNLLDRYNTMVNDGHGFIYEENRLQRGKTRFGINKKDNTLLDKVKTYLKNKDYKYCIYKGSGNNSYNKPQEWLGQNPDKLFKGQICWLTNKENVKNNIIYWLESPLSDLWRIYYFDHSKYSVGCMYGYLPALDFEMPEDKFKEYVDNLNDFSKEDIKTLKKYNIHNTDKL